MLSSGIYADLSDPQPCRCGQAYSNLSMNMDERITNISKGVSSIRN